MALRWRRWVSAHALLVFVVVTYTVMWAAWAGVVTWGGPAWELAGLVGLFAPALVAVLVTRAGDTTPRDRQGRGRWAGAGAVWLVSTVVFTGYVAVTDGPPQPAAIVVYAGIALLPTTVAAAVWSPSVRVRDLLASLRHPPGSPGWYAAALLLPPATLILGEHITRIIGASVLWRPDPPGTTMAGFVAATFAYTLLFAGGLNEETGWTGLVLPRLLRSVNPAVASILVWALWITWHLPFHLSGHWNADTLSFQVALIGTFLARFVFTWLYLRSGGGLWTALLFHTSANVAYAVLPATWTAIALQALLAMVALLTGRMWTRQPPPRATTPEPLPNHPRALEPDNTRDGRSVDGICRV